MKLTLPGFGGPRVHPQLGVDVEVAENSAGRPDQLGPVGAVGGLPVVVVRAGEGMGLGHRAGGALEVVRGLLRGGRSRLERGSPGSRAGDGVGEALRDVHDQVELAVSTEGRGVGVAAGLGEIGAVRHREGRVVGGDGDDRGARGAAGAVHRRHIDDDLVRGRVVDDGGRARAGSAVVSRAAMAPLIRSPPDMVSPVL